MEKVFLVERDILGNKTIVMVCKHKQTAEEYAKELDEKDYGIAKQNGQQYVRIYKVKEIPYFPY